MARADLIQEDESRGARSERWRARPDSQVLVVPETDVEGRAIDDRMLAMFFARDAEVRHGYLADRPIRDDEHLRVRTGPPALAPGSARFVLLDQVRTGHQPQVVAGGAA
jgi:hypothetical protein